MKTTRRELLKASAAFGAFNIVPAKVLWGAGAPSNQLTRALIGFGAIAHSANHLPFKGSRLVGLTDCFAPRVAAGLAAAEKAGWGKVKGYRNFLELIADPGVDIVHICTPPHWHGVQSVMAAKAGKDVWCEKPMTRTVGEGRRVREVVQRNKRMFRLNTWFRFKDTFYGFGTPVEPIRQIVVNGLLGGGPLKCVFGEGQGFTWKFGWSGRVQERAQAVPEGLDWDMWLGPAPWKPYNDHRFGTSFRGYWDYDSGGLGDMAQHYLDPLQYLLCKDDTSPVKIDYRGLKQHPEAVGSFDRFTLTYADGTEVILDGDVSLRDEPLLRGSNGLCVYKKAKGGKTLRIREADGTWWPEEKVLKTLAGLPKPAKQQTDFIDSCVNRRTFALNESNGFRSSTMFNLAIVAWRLGRGFEFDPVTLHAKNDEAAERFLYQDDMMRQPWRKEMFG
ncbi:MAG: Gfo/Idh/MocA family oxidoreductase [Kiritimatiellae bacterium]|nr:Gfo/Idh/MocA family oxidoreductase [Kiritimatiellia bacterium]